MCRFKSSALYAILASILWLSGCVSASTKAYETEQRRAAIERWNACLERNANTSEMPAMQVNNLIGRACEGYKRDVLALYPRNLASEVDQMLVISAYRVIESMNESNNSVNQSGKQIQTVLR
ncbi:MAG: hypothetical protein KTR35_24630 [Gammaproteobacteria bacterium]|nr:hypothetical protein [Gammaproteobacteria bacterium]